MLAMAALYFARSDVALLIAIATIAAAAGTMAMPAQAALIPHLARDTDELGVANATSTTLENLASILGPIVAGILVLAGGLGLACVVNGISFAVVVGLLVRTRTAVNSKADVAVASPAAPASEPAIGPVPSVLEVLRRASRPIVLDTAISFACGALGVLPVLIAVDHLGAGEAFAGLLGAAGGTGAVLGGVAAGVLVNRTPSRAIAAGVVIAAAALGLLAASDSAPVAVVASGTALGALVMLDTLNVTALQRRVPGSHLGRAFGILHTSAAAWLMAGSAIPPIVAGLAGVGSALGLTALVVAGLGAVALLPARGTATAELRVGVASA
jgi:MFS family permease